MELAITDGFRAAALWTSANLLLMLGLGLAVTRRRIQSGTGVGTGDDPKLERAIRAHGNNTEYVPGALILLLLASAFGATPGWLHVAGGGLFVARILHAIGIQQIGPALPPARAAGNVGTWLVLASLGLYVGGAALGVL